MADLHPEVPQEVEHVLHHLQRLPRRLGRGQEQQVDVAERCQHAAAIAAGAGDRQVLGVAEAGIRCGVLVKRGDQPVGEFAKQAGGLKTGDLVLLEGVLHVLLDAREMAAERAKGSVARDRGAVLGQCGERGGEGGDGCLGRLRQVDWGQHPHDRTSSPPRRELPALLSGDTMCRAPRAGSSGPAPRRRSHRPADRSLREVGSPAATQQVRRRTTARP